jgi:hypothetical protein
MVPQGRSMFSLYIIVCQVMFVVVANIVVQCDMDRWMFIEIEMSATYQVKVVGKNEVPPFDSFEWWQMTKCSIVYTLINV